MLRDLYRAQTSPKPPGDIPWARWDPKVAEYPILALHWVLEKKPSREYVAKAFDGGTLPHGLVVYMRSFDLIVVGPSGRFINEVAVGMARDALDWAMHGGATDAK